MNKLRNRLFCFLETGKIAATSRTTGGRAQINSRYAATDSLIAHLDCTCDGLAKKFVGKLTFDIAQPASGLTCPSALPADYE